MNQRITAIAAALLLPAFAWAHDLTLNWTHPEPTKVTRYVVERAFNSTNFTALATNVTALTYTDVVTATGAYSYRVRAANQWGLSVPSNTATTSVDAPPVAPVNVSVTVTIKITP